MLPELDVNSHAGGLGRVSAESMSRWTYVSNYTAVSLNDTPTPSLYTCKYTSINGFKCGGSFIHTRRRKKNHNFHLLHPHLHALHWRRVLTPGPLCRSSNPRGPETAHRKAAVGLHYEAALAACSDWSSQTRLNGGKSLS